MNRKESLGQSAVNYERKLCDILIHRNIAHAESVSRYFIGRAMNEANDSKCMTTDPVSKTMLKIVDVLCSAARTLMSDSDVNAVLNLKMQDVLRELPLAQKQRDASAGFPYKGIEDLSPEMQRDIKSAEKRVIRKSNTIS